MLTSLCLAYWNLPVRHILVSYVSFSIIFMCVYIFRKGRLCFSSHSIKSMPLNTFVFWQCILLRVGRFKLYNFTEDDDRIGSNGQKAIVN